MTSPRGTDHVYLSFIGIETMNLITAYDQKLGLVITTVNGPITVKDIELIAGKAILLANKHECNLMLSDVREATLNISIMDYYSVPTTLAKKARELGRLIHEFRRAVVVKEITDGLRFFENVTFNHMQRMKLFLDMDEAKQGHLEK